MCEKNLYEFISLLENSGDEKEKIVSLPFAQRLLQEISQETLQHENIQNLKQMIITAVYLGLNTDSFLEELVWKVGEDVGYLSTAVPLYHRDGRVVYP